jgi:hypothetical protein
MVPRSLTAGFVRWIHFAALSSHYSESPEWGRRGQPAQPVPFFTCSASATVSTMQAVRQVEKPRMSRSRRPQNSTTNTWERRRGGSGARPAAAWLRLSEPESPLCPSHHLPRGWSGAVCPPTCMHTVAFSRTQPHALGWAESTLG